MPNTMFAAYENEIMTAADRAYRVRCKRQGWIYQIPSRYSSRIEGKHAVLRNVNGELARYKITQRNGRNRLAWVD